MWESAYGKKQAYKVLKILPLKMLGEWSVHTSRWNIQSENGQ